MACSVISHKQQLARCKEVKCSNKDLHLLNLRLQMFSNAEGGFNVCAVPPKKTFYISLFYVQTVWM